MKVYLDLRKFDASYAVGTAVDVVRECSSIFIRQTAVADHVITDKIMTDRDLEEKLKAALAQLDPELRAILEAKYGVGAGGGVEVSGEMTGSQMTDAQVADKLGATAESVKSLEEIALRALYNPNKKLAQ